VLKHYILQALRSFWRFRVTALVNLLGLTLALVCFIATYLFLETLTKSGDSQFKLANRTWVITQELWSSPTNRMIAGFPMASPGTAKYLRADLPGLEAVARAWTAGQMAAAAGDRSAYLWSITADPEFLKIFDFKVLQGDLHDALGSAHGAVITEGGAMRVFGTSNVVGRALLLQNSVQVTINAVIAAPPVGSQFSDRGTNLLRFDLLLAADFVRLVRQQADIPAFDPDDPGWGNDFFVTFVLLPANHSVTPAQLKETLRGFPARHIPKDQLISVFGAVPLEQVKLASMEALTGNRGIPLTTSPFLLDALILAIACLNYANLTVAIATTRAREIGMRKVLGAGQPQLVRQHLLEAALIGMAALILVLVGTVLAVPVINRAFGLEFHLAALLRPTLWALVALLLVLISLAGGAYPALVLARVRPVEALRSANVRAGPRFVPTILVGVQFAAASFLLVVALLMHAQNSLLQRVAIRPDHDPVVTMGNSLNAFGVPFERLRTELLRDQRIKAVSASAARPWQMGGPHQYLRRSRNSAAVPVAMVDFVTYDLFQTMDIKILAGRDFDRGHNDPMFNWNPAAQKGDPSVILDRKLLRELGWIQPEQAVDQTIYLAAPWDASVPDRPLHVIGVADEGFPRLIGPSADSSIYMMSAFASDVPLVRISRDDIPGALAHIDAVWKSLVPNAPSRRYFTDELFNEGYQNYTAVSSVLTGLSVFAFIIAIMGLVGMALHITSRRLREIGIRKTLGASAHGVVLMLLRDFSKPVLIANVIAWPFAFFAGHLYFDLFMQRASVTAWPFVTSLAITLAIAWLAVGAQAMRAAAVKPANVLHAE
jgi:putative ABC transport system permease protein